MSIQRRAFSLCAVDIRPTLSHPSDRMMAPHTGTRALYRINFSYALPD